MKGFFRSRIWKKAPFLRLLIAVIAGILIQDIFPISKWVSIAVMSTGLILTVFSLSATPLAVFRFHWVSGFLVTMLFAGTGSQLSLAHRDQPLLSRKNRLPVTDIIIKVQNAPTRKNKSFRCEVAVLWSVSRRRCYLEREQLLLYFRDSSVAAAWIPGSLWLLHAVPRPVSNDLQPVSKGLSPQQNGFSPERNGNEQKAPALQSFDYAAWCARRHIYGRAFVHAGTGRLLMTTSFPELPTLMTRMQERLRAVCRKYVPDLKEGGLLEALLIGYTRDLDPEVLRSYSDAGVVHIIAISGLHLALIGELLGLILLRLGLSGTARLCRLLLLLIVVWGYSLLTGASPSVLRSAVMCSFVVLARHFALQAPVINALAGSAFLLLCDDPNRLWDTGFQLSYAAVISLVLFSAPVRRLLKFRNKTLDSIWAAASVSLAAQVLTTPLSIWYFHRFPFYFLLTNLVAVPLSSGILIGGIVLMICSGLPALATLLGILLDQALKLMNGFVDRTNLLPGASATGLQLRPLQLILCYAIIYCFCRFLEKGEKRWVFLLLTGVCLFLADGLNS